MDKKFLLIAFLLLAISTEEMMARNLLLRAYRDKHQRSKRADSCPPLNIPCSEVSCVGECYGLSLGCYQGLCMPLDADPYKKKRSVDSPMEI